MKKVIAFSGSNSSKSINQRLAIMASSFVDGAEVEVISLRDYPAAIYSSDDEELSGFPDTMKALQEKMGEADGFIVSSPEHNGSMPAVLKNSIDWVSRLGRKVFNDKPTVFLTTSPGPRGGASALAHLLAIMPYQGAQVVGGYSLGSFHEKVEQGTLKSGEDKDRIEELIKELSRAL